MRHFFLYCFGNENIGETNFPPLLERASGYIRNIIYPNALQIQQIPSPKKWQKVNFYNASQKLHF